MRFIASAVAEETAALTTEEATIIGAIAGLSFGVVITLMLVWYVLRAIADWRIFTKAGEAGWKSLIPFYSSYIEYGICWNGKLGLIYSIVGALVAGFGNGEDASSAFTLLSALLLAGGIVTLVLHAMQSMKLAKAFGK